MDRELGISFSKTAHKSVLEKLFPPWTWAVNVPMLVAAIVAAAAVGAITAIVVLHPYQTLEVSLERAIQTTNLGPLTLTFPFFTWLGGPGGVPMQAVVILLVLLLNRRSWRLAVAALAGGLWYEIIVRLVNRSRPILSQILRVTEHPWIYQLSERPPHLHHDQRGSVDAVRGP